MKVAPLSIDVDLDIIRRDRIAGCAKLGDPLRRPFPVSNKDWLVHRL